MPNSSHLNVKKYLDHLPFTIYYSRAFTLIEVLVAIAITALAGVIALPGLRSFADRQQLSNSFNQLQTTINQTRSNAQNKAICVNNGAASTDWQLYFDSNSSFSIRALCPESNTQTTFPQKDTTITLSTSPTPQTCTKDSYINFNNATGQASLYCNGLLVASTDKLSLTIKLNSNPSITKTININQGGVPSEN